MAIGQLLIGTAPIKEFITTRDKLTDIWNAWLSQVGYALAGKWLFTEHNVNINGLTGSTSTNNVIMYRGSIIHIDFNWTGTITTLSSEITLPFTAKNTNIELHYLMSGVWEIESLEVKGNTITIPDIIGMEELTIKGTLMKDGVWKTRG